MLSSKGKIRVELEKKKILCWEVGSDSIRRIRNSRLFEETKGPEICTYLASNSLSQRKVDAL